MTQPDRLAPLPVDRRTVLVLQGGGALGSYQAGVFEGLAEGGLAPDWVAGVSIGAINASLIAGNAPEQRVEKLRAFWSRITAPVTLLPDLKLDLWRQAEQRLGALSAVLFGQPGFFRPRPPLEWLSQTPPISFYDTSHLRATLEELVDFDRINAGPTRLSVGAVEVETGNMTYFDSTTTKLRPEHVMASGALPPGLEMVEIDGSAYWDGGLVSNTPLQYVAADAPRRNSLVFQVDLFPARGKRPTNMDEASERDKDIRYSSRTRSGTDSTREVRNQRRAVARFLERLPPELNDDPAVEHLRAIACPVQMDVAHLIYHPTEPQGSQKDFQFDRNTMQRRWQHGLADARRTLKVAPWNHPASPETAFRTFDVLTPARKKH